VPEGYVPLAVRLITSPIWLPFRRRCAERLCACLLTTVSLIVLSAALYVILSGKYPAKVENWAYATIGTVLGFWLRQA
jgi:hypothetical protein